MENGDNTEVGVRQLRDSLSRYLARVRAGTSITVTDHGRAIARLVPLSGERVIDRLVAEGVVTPAQSKARARPRPIGNTPAVSDLVAEQRR